MRSVFDQSYENIEYIVIDANSTDGTLDVIQACETAWTISSQNRTKEYTPA